MRTAAVVSIISAFLHVAQSLARPVSDHAAKAARGAAPAHVVLVGAGRGIAGRVADSGVPPQVRGAARTAQALAGGVSAGRVVAVQVAVGLRLHLGTAGGVAEAGVAHEVLVVAGHVVAGSDAGGGGQVCLEAVLRAPATGVVVVHALGHVAGGLADRVVEHGLGAAWGAVAAVAQVVAAFWDIAAGVADGVTQGGG